MKYLDGFLWFKCQRNSVSVFFAKSETETNGYLFQWKTVSCYKGREPGGLNGHLVRSENLPMGKAFRLLSFEFGHTAVRRRFRAGVSLGVESQVCDWFLESLIRFVTPGVTRQNPPGMEKGLCYVRR